MSDGRSADELVFAPLGGVGEIGMNLAIYGLGDERRRTWLVVDRRRVVRQEENLPGIDLIFPDIRYLVEERRNIAGIVLTHAHEDHFGAMLDLWPKLKVPVYATPFTAALLEAKRQGEYGAPEIPVTECALGSRFNVGPFDIELVSVAHSIPESNALILRTPHGNVLHTGDWKLDPTPVLGPPTDEAKLRALGAEGCLVLIGDSTNAVREGRSPSESDVAKTLTELIVKAPRRVAVTTFASNVARIKAVADAARAGRARGGRGRPRHGARHRRSRARPAISTACSRFHGMDVYGHLPPDKVVALCTGSQGEPRAALARIAAGRASRGGAVEGRPRDLLVAPHSRQREGDRPRHQRPDRPGRRGHHRPHASGACLRPSAPGRARRHDRLGQAAHRHSGARRVAASVRTRGAGAAARRRARVMIRNGDLVGLRPASPRSSTRCRPGRIYKDGSLLIQAEARTVADRKRLSFSGIDQRGAGDQRQGPAAGRSRGRADRHSRTTPPTAMPMDDIAYDAVVETFDTLPKPRRRDPDSVAEAIRRGVRAAVAQHWRKKPNVTVHVLIV